MSKSLNQIATDALAALEKMASANDAINELCKQAGVEGDDAEYVEKFAREFEQVSGLSAEDLVKRALRRFNSKQDTDALFTGIQCATSDDRVKCAAACTLIGSQDLRERPEDAAVVAALEKKAGVFSSLGAAMKGPVVKGLGAMGSALKSPFAKAVGRFAGPAGLVGAGALGQYGISRAMGGDDAAMKKMWPVMMDEFSRSGNAGMLVQMLRASGKNYDPKILDALERSLAYRRNPWAPSYWS